MNDPPAEDKGFANLAAILSGVVITVFTGLAVFFSHVRSRRCHVDRDAFISARNSQPWHRIAWSLFSGSVGAWAVVFPGLMVMDHGFLFSISYALACSLPIIVIAHFGVHLRKKLIKPVAFSDYVRARYGRVCELFIMSIVVLNMAVFLISEYCNIGSVFIELLSLSPAMIVIPMAVVTVAYTVHGGIYASILTDNLQGIFCVLLVVILAVYTFSSKYMYPDSSDLVIKPMKIALTNPSCWSATYVVVVSVLGACILSDAYWQRVWAARSSRDLLIGSYVAFGGLFLCIFFFGYLSYFGITTNVDESDLEGYSGTTLWTLFGKKSRFSWASMVTLLLTVTMNQSAIDSLQNALSLSAITVVSRFYCLDAETGGILPLPAAASSTPSSTSGATKEQDEISGSTCAGTIESAAGPLPGAVSAGSIARAGGGEIAATKSAKIATTKKLRVVSDSRLKMLACLLLLLVNIPLVVIACLIRDTLYPIVFINTVGLCVLPPLLLGAFECTRELLQGTTMIFSFVAAVIAVTINGVIINENKFIDGFKHAWWENGFRFTSYYVTGPVASLVAAIIFGCCRITVAKFLMRFPNTIITNALKTVFRIRQKQ